MCGRSLRSDHFGREPYPLSKGPRAVVDLFSHAAGRRVRARQLIEAFARKGLGRRHASDAQARAREMRRRDVRPPSDSRIPKRGIPNEKARGGFLRAGLMIFAMMSLCQ